LMIALLAASAGACTRNEAANANDNANAAATAAAQTTQPAPDNSEVTTSVDANGTRTETRVFKNNPRISKVVVTTRDGRRTVKAYSASGEEREVTKTAAKEVGDKAEDVKDKTVSTSKKVGEKTVDVSKTVGEKTADTAKTVGDKTVEGAKKVGSATKKAVKKVIP